MANVDWPTDLPNVEIQSWAIEPAPLTVRSEMESGPARVRRISTQRNDTITVSWTLSRVQFAQFRTFFQTSLKHGVEWFNMPLFAGVTPDGACNNLEEARFIGQWKASAINANYIRVSAELEVR